MKVKLGYHLCLVCLFFIVFSGCGKTGPSASIPMATPTAKLIESNWAEFSSYFTSDVGRIEYSFQYPAEWYIYPGSTRSIPGLEDETFIQSFPKENSNTEYQPPDSIRLKIYALPCAITQEGCDVSSIDTIPITESMEGTKTIQYLAGNTVWTVFLYTENYRFMMQGYLKGEYNESSEQIRLLDKIASTIKIK
jgi:hypothetical protein